MNVKHGHFSNSNKINFLFPKGKFQEEFLGRIGMKELENRESEKITNLNS